jgi:hypothetical protein
MAKRLYVGIVIVPQSISINTMVSRILLGFRSVGQLIVVNPMNTQIASMSRSSTQVIYINTGIQNMGRMVRSIPQQININTMVGRVRTGIRSVSQIININTMERNSFKFFRGVYQIIYINTMISRIINLFINYARYIGVSMANLQSGENGSIYTLLRDVKGDPTPGADCGIIIKYPNSTAWLSDTMVDFKNGLYYYNFTTPQTEGIYEADVNCTYYTQYIAETSYFHVIPLAQELQQSMAQLNAAQQTLDTIKNEVDKIPGLGNSIDSLTNTLRGFGVNLYQAFLLGLAVIISVILSIIGLGLWIWDDMRGEEKSAGYM